MRDIYYVLFRHKWLIIILAVLGVAASLAVYSLWQFPYTSGSQALDSFHAGHDARQSSRTAMQGEISG